MFSSSLSVPRRFFEKKLHVRLLTLCSNNRYAHTDLPKVSFQDYRRKSLQNSNVSAKRNIDERKTTTYAMSFGTFCQIRSILFANAENTRKETRK